MWKSYFEKKSIKEMKLRLPFDSLFLIQWYGLTILFFISFREKYLRAKSRWEDFE